MRLHNTAILAAVALVSAASASLATPARADDMKISGYGNLGYSYLHSSPEGYSADLGAITARGGLRFGPYLGAEGEANFGVVDKTASSGGYTARLSLDNSYAAYAVGYWPAHPKIDLFARVGYGSARIKLSASGGGFSGTGTLSGDFWAVGAGGQYFFDANNGVRGEYTRYTSTDTSNADVDAFTLSYVRKF
jgi:hypothetical protein